MTPFARLYSRNTAHYLDDHRRTARKIADRLPPGARVLEIAPGPGYLSIELARLGAYRITGLDISKSFVRIAAENARAAGVDVEFRLGDAHALPFPAGAFDFIVCAAQMHLAGAAFVMFRNPVAVLAEIQRTLKVGAGALIVDVRKPLSAAAVEEFVKRRARNRLNALLTGWLVKHAVGIRGYDPGDMRAFAAEAGFRSFEVKECPIAMELWLRRDA